MYGTRYSCHILMKHEFSRKMFSNIKFDEHPSSGSRVSPCGRTDIQTAMKNLIDAFRNFKDAPNKTTLLHESEIFFKSVHNSCISLPCCNSFSTIWWTQKMWSDVICYVQVHTEDFEIFRPRLQFTCTENWWEIFFIQW
jgi:hypothetical protein